MSSTTNPPKPRLALRVGVTGHRHLEQADLPLLEQQIGKALQLIRQVFMETTATDAAKAAYENSTGLCLLSSPLAEGTDRLAARQALAQQYRLQCPLPFAREEYAKDFSHDGASLQEFHTLLEKADAVFELDGVAQRRDEAYLTVGQLVLRHSDIVLAVWDGEEIPTSVGTAGIIAKAKKRRLPIVLIAARAPHELELIGYDEHGGVRQTALEALQLRKTIEGIVLPPSALLGNEASSQPTEAHGSHGLSRLIHYCCKTETNPHKAYHQQTSPRRNLLNRS